MLYRQWFLTRKVIFLTKYIVNYPLFLYSFTRCAENNRFVLSSCIKIFKNIIYNYLDTIGLSYHY